MTINEPPAPKTDAEKLKLLWDVCAEAYEFLEHYCSCKVRGQVAKKLRVALKATEAECPSSSSTKVTSPSSSE